MAKEKAPRALKDNEAKAVARAKMLRQPGLRRRVDQRFDSPCLGVDLLGSLERIAPVDKDRGLVGQHDGEARRAGKAGQPRQPLLGGRDIFVLLLVGARHHEAAQVVFRQFLAKRGQARGQGNAGLGLVEGLEVCLKH